MNLRSIFIANKMTRIVIIIQISISILIPNERSILKRRRDILQGNIILFQFQCTRYPRFQQNILYSSFYKLRPQFRRNTIIPHALKLAVTEATLAHSRFCIIHFHITVFLFPVWLFKRASMRYPLDIIPTPLTWNGPSRLWKNAPLIVTERTISAFILYVYSIWRLDRHFASLLHIRSIVLVSAISFFQWNDIYVSYDFKQQWHWWGIR